MVFLNAHLLANSAESEIRNRSQSDSESSEPAPTTWKITPCSIYGATHDDKSMFGACFVYEFFEVILNFLVVCLSLLQCDVYCKPLSQLKQWLIRMLIRIRR